MKIIWQEILLFHILNFLYSTLYSVMCVWEKLWVAKCVLQWFLYRIFVEGGCVNYCCSKIEKRRIGWSYHCHSCMRILSGSVQRRSHRGVFTLKMQSVTVNKCMYVYIVIKIKNKNKKIHYFKWYLNNKANIIGNRTFKVIMTKLI